MPDLEIAHPARQGNLAMIRYSCPDCGERIQVDDSKAGRAHACPLCGRSTLVPGERPAERVPQGTPPARPVPQVPVVAPQPAAHDLPPEVRVGRLEELRALERARPLVQTEWLEAAEHYRALNQHALAAQMEQRAAVAAQHAGNPMVGPGGQPQIVIVNQNTNVNEAASGAATNTQTSASELASGCVSLGILSGCLWFWFQFGCLVPILAGLLTVVLACVL